VRCTEQAEVLWRRRTAPRERLDVVDVQLVPRTTMDSVRADERASASIARVDGVADCGRHVPRTIGPAAPAVVHGRVARHDRHGWAV
jgi:hypothetical protein